MPGRQRPSPIFLKHFSLTYVIKMVDVTALKNSYGFRMTIQPSWNLRLMLN